VKSFPLFGVCGICLASVGTVIPVFTGESYW
jgi:energy-converting hydrogenase Eha subunit H